jgi:hypothetical protein
MKRFAAVLVTAAALALGVPAASAGAAVLKVDPHHLDFGKQAFDTFTLKTITITNVSSTPVLVGFEELQVPDDFSPGQTESTCPIPDQTLVGGGDSCTQVVGYSPISFFAGHESATIRVTARDPASGELLDSLLVMSTGKAVAP